MKPFLVCFLPLTSLPEYLFGAGSICISPQLLSGSDYGDFHRQDSQNRSYQQPSKKADLPKLKVLLADDDKDDQELFRDAIAEINPGINIEIATDGLELMQKLNSGERKLPDMIFLDLNMPCKSGKECLSEIRLQQELKKIPVIIFSTSASANDIKETKSKGADLYMRKPNSYTSLVQMIQNVITRDFEKYRNSPDQGDFLLTPPGI